jgi:type I restriction enzyme S subunit
MVTLTLPDQWAPCTLDAAISHNGLISDGDWIESKDQDPSGSVRLIQLADIGDGEFRNKSQRYMSPQKALALNCTYLKKGDVLIARMPDPLGRACLFPNINQPAVTVVDICVIRVSNESAINNRLLKYWINSPEFRSLMDQNASGTTRKRITRKKLETFEIPLPPLVEQKVIADKLDELLAEVDTLKARLDAIPATLKRFRQSVLAAAVSGKLTEEWRSKNKPIEPVNVESILTARKAMWAENEQHKMLTQGITATNEKWRKKYKEPDSVLEEDCFPIPEEWSWASLGQLTYSVKDGPHYSPKYADTGVPFISGGNITPEGINFSKTKFITHELNEELCKRCKPEVGDVLYTKGGTTGIAYFNQETAEFNVWVHVAVLKITNVINGKYLQHSLNSKHCYSLAQRYTHGVGNQDLGLTRMIKITIPVPPIEEQTEIVRKVEQLFTYADQVEQQVKNAQARVNQLTQSILAKAFRGELTEQWRQDNPELISGDNSAAALLQRIKAERAAAKPAKKTQGRKVQC